MWAGSPMRTGRKTKRRKRKSSERPETSAYLRMKLAMIVLVVITVTRPSSRIFWKVPASWSAWQCVRMTCVILRDAMPFSRR